MVRRSKQVVNAEINRLRRYIQDNISKNDTEIIAELGIKEHTFYNYKARIREQDKQAWLDIAKEPLEAAALRVKESLDYCKRVSKDVAEKSQDGRARIEAAKKVVECDMMLYKMLENGPTSKTVIIPKVNENSTDRRMESLGTNTVTTQ